MHYHLYVLLFTTLFLIACGGDTTHEETKPGDTTPTNEKLGRMCEVDDDCGEVSVCEMGICMRQCQTEAACDDTGNATDVCARAPGGTTRFVCIDDAFVNGCTPIKDSDPYCNAQEAGTVCCTAGGNPEGFCTTRENCDSI